MIKIPLKIIGIIGIIKASTLHSIINIAIIISPIVPNILYFHGLVYHLTITLSCRTGQGHFSRSTIITHP